MFQSDRGVWSGCRADLDWHVHRFDRGMVNGRMIDALLTILLFAGLFVIALLGMAFVLLYYALLAVIAVLFIPVALIVVLADAIFTR